MQSFIQNKTEVLGLSQLIIELLSRTIRSDVDLLCIQIELNVKELLFKLSLLELLPLLH
jgi:hypothetical protein